MYETLCEIFCEDVVQNILENLCATIIQNAFRRWTFSFAKKEEWKLVRRTIINVLGTTGLKHLQNDPRIRREFRGEIHSWMFTVVKEPHNLTKILDELMEM